MNHAIKSYAKAWTGHEADFGDPCLQDIENPAPNPEPAPEVGSVKVLVTCQDYGQAIALPCYKLSRPNVDYFNSDLNVQMFNICHLGNMQNSVFLYDERYAGKDSSAVLSMRWLYHAHLIKKLLAAGETLPKMSIKIMTVDHCK